MLASILSSYLNHGIGGTWTSGTGLGEKNEIGQGYWASEQGAGCVGASNYTDCAVGSNFNDKISTEMAEKSGCYKRERDYRSGINVYIVVVG